LSDFATDTRIRIAIDLADLDAAGKVAEALEEAPGVEIVAREEEHDLVLSRPFETRHCEAPDVQLTAREQEVLMLLADGASNKDIARRLAISTHTAKFHVASLLEKLDAVSRTDAVALAARLGVIHL